MKHKAMDQNIQSDKEMGYLEYFGLDRNPFPIAPDDDNFFISDHIEQVLTEIIHGIVARKGFMVLSGDTGLGKTSISRRILHILEEKHIETSLVFHTSCRDIELLRVINRDFGLSVDSRRFGDQLNALSEFLTEKHQSNRNCAIIIDDAQNLDHKSLELIRMISNYEADQEKLVQILMIGQPELLDKLNQPDLRQLKSRVIIWQQVRSLQPAELESYLFFKLNMSGNTGQITIPRSASKAIHRRTDGNLRMVNILLDRCLYAAYIEDTRTITRAIVDAAFTDIQAQTTKPTHSRKLAVGFLAAILLLILFFPAWSPDILLLNPFSAKPRHPVRGDETTVEKALPPSRQAKDISAPVSVSRPESAPALLPVMEPKPPPTPISLFLNAYRLPDFEEQFQQAIAENDFQRLSRNLFQKVGYRLVRLKSLPVDIKGRYDILIRRSKTDNQKEYILLWQPRQIIEQFYYGYRGKEIIGLQQSLQAHALYDARIDGIVGPKVLKGIVDFQKLWNLPVTGYPDEATLFLLSHVKGSNDDEKTEKKVSG